MFVLVIKGTVKVTIPKIDGVLYRLIHLIWKGLQDISIFRLSYFTILISKEIHCYTFHVPRPNAGIRVPSFSSIFGTFTCAILIVIFVQTNRVYRKMYQNIADNPDIRSKTYLVHVGVKTDIVVVCWTQI